MQPATRNAALIQALSACAAARRQRRARRFLEGLSTDELQYIAAYLGACTIEHTCAFLENVSSLAGPDEHKRILLVEFLRSCGLPA